MHRVKLRALLIAYAVAACLTPARSGAEFYSYDDKDGTTHFVDDLAKIPKEYRKKTQVRKDAYDDLPAGERARMLDQEREKRAVEQRREAEQARRRLAAEEKKAAEERQKKALATPVVIAGRQVFVPVRLANGSTETNAMLLLDTGATSSVITPEVADRLNIQEGERVLVGVVGGRVMNARKVILSHMEVGPIRRTQQEAVIVRQRQGEFGDGLLGMSFLGGLKYTIDFASQTINWMP